MPYAQTTPVITRKRIDGRNYLLVTFSETLCAPADQWTVTGLPFLGQIVRYKATLTAGTGANIAPKIGRATAFTEGTKDVHSQDWIGTLSPASPSFDEAGPLVYHAADWTTPNSCALFGRSTPSNAAADHTIYTEIVILEGAVP